MQMAVGRVWVGVTPPALLPVDCSGQGRMSNEKTHGVGPVSSGQNSEADHGTRAQVAQACAQRAARGEATVEGAGGTNAPPAGPSGVCAASAARPGTSRDSVQAVVLPGRHRRPVTSPMTQLGSRAECPSLPPWCTYNVEPSCLIAPPVETRPRRL